MMPLCRMCGESSNWLQAVMWWAYYRWHGYDWLCHDCQARQMFTGWDGFAG